MRTREEIENNNIREFRKEGGLHSGTSTEFQLLLEVLLDIRDKLDEVLKGDFINYNQM